MNGIKVLIFLIIILSFSGILFFWRLSYPRTPERLFITDEYGRKLIFHGMNVISAAKSDPLRVGGTAEQDFLDLSERWGFNAVRFLIFWDALEPEKGQYDRNYIERVKTRLDWCENAGLSVILDMHQDLYALRYGGDGAPDWAIIDDGESFESQTPWELNYRQPAVRASIDNFWNPKKSHAHELQDHYIKAMVFALDELASHPAVIGVDLYNEPTMATVKGLLTFERRYLTPFLQKAIDEIRHTHSDLWIFFEPSALGPNQGFRTGLRTLIDPRQGESRLVYFPHIYTLDLDIKGRYAGHPLHINWWSHSRSRELKQFKTPLMVGEFGLGEDKPGAIDYLNEVLNRFDLLSSGWFYWSYDPGSWGIIDSQGNEMAKAHVLTRPYPRQIAGQRPDFSWDRERNEFSLSYTTVPAGGRGDMTEVYLPPRYFPNGGSLENRGIDIYQNWDGENHILTITPQTCGRIDFIITSP